MYVQVSSLPGGLVHQVQSCMSHKLIQTLLVVTLGNKRPGSKSRVSLASATDQLHLLCGFGGVFQLEQWIVAVAHDHKVVATRHLFHREWVELASEL